MNPLAWLNPYRWLLYGGLLLALTAGYYGWRSHERGIGAAPYITAIAAQKTEADRVLAIETAKVEATQKQLELALLTQEKTDALNKQTTDSLGARLRRLAAATDGRLRDPAGCGAGSAGSTGATNSDAKDRAGDGAQTAGLLSKPISDLFIRLTSEADDVNNAYASCRADALTVRTVGPAALPE